MRQSRTRDEGKPSGVSLIPQGAVAAWTWQPAAFSSSSAWGADDAMRRPRHEEVGGVGKVVGWILVVVTRRHDELILRLEVADVPGDHRGHRHSVRHGKAATLDEIGLDIDHQQSVSHPSPSLLRLASWHP